MNCPKCDCEMTREEAEPDVGIMVGGWFCESCDVFVPEWDVDDEP